MHVFVYGTLKQGEPNHHWMTEPGCGLARLVGVARSKQKFPLVVAGRYNTPYCLHYPGEGHHLLGEVYQIDEHKLKNLDVLEVYPTHYNRKLEKFQLIDETESQPLLAWIYVWEKFTEHHLQLKFLDNYTNMDQPQERQYVCHEDRD